MVELFKMKKLRNKIALKACTGQYGAAERETRTDKEGIFFLQMSAPSINKKHITYQIARECVLFIASP